MGKQDTGPGSASQLPPELLASIVDTAPLGIAVIAGDGSCAYVNGHGQHLLGAASGQEAALAVGTAGRAPGGLAQRWPALRFSEPPLPAAGGQRIITFAPATGDPEPDGGEPGRRGAAGGSAEPGSLVGTLDSIASQIRDDLRLAAANIVLHGATGTGHPEILGGAGFAGSAEDRLARLERCDALGAEFKHREASRARRLVVVPHRYESVMRDPRWAPAHSVLQTVEWDGFAAAPLEARGRIVGTLSAFYEAGLEPAHQAELERLAVAASQAALAVDSAGLLVSARSRAVARRHSRPGGLPAGHPPPASPETTARPPIGILTPREREVLGLLAEGCSNQEIARRLEITERTARTHVSNLLGKLRLESRTQAALLAYQEGLPVFRGAARSHGLRAAPVVRDSRNR